MFKQIYSFTIQSEKEVEKITKEIMKNDEGVEEEVEVKKKVKEKYPIEFIIKKPSRRQLEEADTEYSIAMSQSIKKGILTKAMLAKKYADSGGALTEKDAQELLDNYKKLSDLEQEVTRMAISGYDEKDIDQKTKAKKINDELTVVKRQIVDLETNYQTIFAHTADIKAQQTTVLWYLLHLTYIQYDLDGSTSPSLYFTGKTFEDKLDNYYEKDESSDEIFNKVINKLTTIISYWYYSGDNFDEAQVAALVKSDLDEPEE